MIESIIRIELVQLKTLTKNACPTTCYALAITERKLIKDEESDLLLFPSIEQANEWALEEYGKVCKQITINNEE